MKTCFLYKILPFLQKNQGIYDTFTLSTGIALAQAITVVASLVLTRLYTAEQFGIFSLYTVIVLTLSALACLCYETAIILPEDDREAEKLLIASFIIALFMACVSLVIVLLYGQKLAYFLKAPGLLPMLWWAPLSVLAVGIYQALTYWSNRHRRFKNLSISRVWQSGVTAVTQIGVASTGSGAGGLIYGSILGQVVAPLVLVTKAVKASIQSLRKEGLNFREYAQLLYRYRKFPLYSTWGTLMNVTTFMLVPIYLSTLFGPAVSGFYFLGYRIVSIPMSLIGSALGQVLLQRIAEQLSQGRNISRLVEMVIGRSILLWMPPFFLLTLAAPQVFSIAFGSKWMMAGRYVQVLTPLFFLQIVTSPISVVLIALEKQQVLTVLQALLLVGSIGSLSIAGYFFSNPLASMGIFAAVQSIVYLIYLSAIVRYSSASMHAILREATSYKGSA